MEGLVFEVVEGPVVFEDVELGIGYQGEGEFSVFFEVFEGILQAFDFIGADADQ